MCYLYVLPKNLLLKNKGYPLFKNNNYTLSEIKTNILSGITVALAMVPEAIAFALIAHVSPLTGLYALVIFAGNVAILFT